MQLLVAMVGSALGAPEFRAVEGDRKWAALAARAWDAGERCMGRSAAAADVVEIAEVEFMTLAGRAGRKDGRLERIELDPVDADARTLLHEVAHAWFHGPVSVYSEGGAQVLADCMAADLGHWRWRAPREMVWPDVVPVLSTWENDGLSRTHYRGMGYAASYYWVRELVRSVGLQQLPDTAESWEGLRSGLEEHGDYTRYLLNFAEAAHSSPEWRDIDEDGLPGFAEAYWKLDPRDWDTDGDGAFDGVLGHKTPGVAQALPPDGQCHCALTPVDASEPWVEGIDQHGWFRRKLNLCLGDGRLLRSPGYPMTVWPKEPASRQGAGCLETPEAIGLVDAAGLSGATLERAMGLVAGNPSQRLVVRFGGSVTTVRGQTVVVSSDEVRWAARRGRADVLAELVNVLSTYAELGVVPSEAWVNDELAIVVGEGVRWVRVGE